MRVLVTGAAGFLGGHLLNALAAEDCHVTAFDLIPAPDNLLPSISWVQGSILDEAGLKRAMTGVTHVYHLAALTHLGVVQSRQYAAINHHGSQAVINMAQRCDIDHLIITSTEVILRGWQNDSLKPLTEAEALPAMRDMAGPYSRSKLAAEMATRQAIEAGQPISIVYPTVPIGAGDWSFTAPTAMIKNFLYTPPPAILDCSLNFVAAKDVARGHILAAQQPPGGRYILGGQDMTMAKFLDYLAPHSQKKMPQQTVPYALAALTAHGAKALSQFTQKAPLASVEGVRLAKYKTYIDSSHARETLGWKTMAIEAAIDEAAYWIKQHHEV